MKRFFYGLFPLLLLTSAFGQDWIRTGTGLGVEKVRIAVPDFNAASQDPKNTELLKDVNDTLWNDLDNAGIAESKIYFVSTRTGHKEIWAMDYDGANQHALTHLGSISLSPRVSPDGSRVAFSSLTKSGWEILMYSLELDRLVTFPRFGGTNLSPAWSPDGTRIAFSSSRSGDPEIYVVDASGTNPKRITSFKGPDVSPTWNRKTGAQI